MGGIVVVVVGEGWNDVDGGNNKLKEEEEDSRGEPAGEGGPECGWRWDWFLKHDGLDLDLELEVEVVRGRRGKGFCFAMCSGLVVAAWPL